MGKEYPLVARPDRGQTGGEKKKEMGSDFQAKTPGNMERKES